MNVPALKRPTKSATADYLIAGNLLYTTAGQVAAVRVDASAATGVVVRGNLLRGEERRVLVEGKNDRRVIVRSNDE